MREIKFRGVSAIDGHTVYGDLRYGTTEVYVDCTPVNSESVSQFCGVDSEGNEIYEGDEVIAHDKIYTVELKPKYGLFNDLKFSLKK